MNSPARDIKDLVNSDSSIGLTFGTDLFCFKQPDSPDLCVTIYDTGGFAPTPNYRYDRPTIQVRIRGEQNGYQAAYTIAENIKELLRDTHNQQINNTLYVGCWVQSDIFHIGYDKRNRPEFTVNFRLHRR